MREYKFRAWHTGDWANKPQMIFDEKQGDCLVWKSQGQPITVMQYTGLKDKNGKEIYEGDLWVPISCETPRIVKWNTNGYWFHYPKNGAPTRLAEYTEDGEVIGNIYENHELLEVTP